MSAGGVVSRFGPAMPSLAEFAGVLDAAGSQVVLQPNGTLRVSIGGIVYVVRPYWSTLTSQPGREKGFSFGEAGLVFTDSNGIGQGLVPDVADHAGMMDLLAQALSMPVEIRMGLDMLLEVVAQGVVYKLAPEYTLAPAGVNPVEQSWWEEGGKLYIRYPDGWVQGFGVRP